MQQIAGGWRLDELRDGAARLVLKSAMGAEVYMDLAPDDLGEMRARLDAIAPVAPEPASPEKNPAPGPARHRRARA